MDIGAPSLAADPLSSIDNQSWKLKRGLAVLLYGALHVTSQWRMLRVQVQERDRQLERTGGM